MNDILFSDLLRREGFGDILADLGFLLEGSIPLRFWGTLKLLYPDSLLLNPLNLRIIDVGDIESANHRHLSFFIKVRMGLELFEINDFPTLNIVSNPGLITKGKFALLRTRANVPKQFLNVTNVLTRLDRCKSLLDVQYCYRDPTIRNASCLEIFSTGETSKCSFQTDLALNGPCTFDFSDVNFLVVCPFLGAKIKVTFSFPKNETRIFSNCQFIEPSGYTLTVFCLFKKQEKQILDVDLSGRRFSTTNYSSFPIVDENVTLPKPSHFHRTLGPLVELSLFFKSNKIFRSLSILGSIVAFIFLFTFFYKVTVFLKKRGCSFNLPRCSCFKRTHKYKVAKIRKREVITSVSLPKSKKALRRRVRKEIKGFVIRLESVVEKLQLSDPLMRTAAYSKNLEKIQKLLSDLNFLRVCLKADKNYVSKMSHVRWCDEIFSVKRSLSHLESNLDTLHVSLLGRLAVISPILLLS